MAKPTFLYHENHPRGKIWDLESFSEDLLVEQGWVDNPAKVGYDAWNGNHEAMHPTRDAFKNGRLPAIGGQVDVGRTTSEEAAQAIKERDEAHARLRVRDSEVEELRRSLKDSKEKLADHRSDAEKKREKRPGESAPALAAANAKRLAAKTPAETPAAPPDIGGDTDL